MARRTIAILLLLIAAMVAWYLSRPDPIITGPLQNEVYVWQRTWTPSVREAIEDHGTNFTQIVPLKAEIIWKDKRPQLVRASVDYAVLAAVRRPIGIALRIGPYAGPFVSISSSQTKESDGKAITGFLCDVAASMITEARSNGIALSELQIDFDCAASKLDGYLVWVGAIQNRVAPLPVTVTALPSWLNVGAFKRLAKAATNYVLQVHSLERPASADAPFTLCDPNAASRAVKTAGKLGVPFRVAMPTYGYTLAFSADGKFLGLSAEGPRREWSAQAQTREVYANPLEIAELVKFWTANRPAAMRGIIWYRMPVTSDKLNWRWPTLAAILATRSPRESLRAETRRVESGLTEINLVNDGELDISSRLAVDVRWSNARLVAADALRDFEMAEARAATVRFQTKSNFIRLPAGDSQTVGWLRFSRECEVNVEIKK